MSSKEIGTALTFVLKHNLFAFARDYLVVRRRVDQEELARIRREYLPRKEEYLKYLRLDYFLLYNLFRCYSLGLHRGGSRNVLDIGSGAGYFAHVCSVFGHYVHAIDVEDFPVFNEMIKAFKIRRTVWRIEPLESLPELPVKFDVVTAFRTTFNLPTDHNPGDRTWGRREWGFLIEDLMTHHVRSGGRIYLQLNRAKKYGDYYDRDLLEFFRERAASVDRGKILIKISG